jgi:3-phenylpropionate/trans-cinnamate dioxygenase ferredoxin component
VVRVGDRVFALADQCSHQAMPLSAGYVVLGDTDAPQLECAWHGARFDCASGRAIRGPAEEPVATYEVSVVDGRVEIGKRQRQT